MRIAYFDCVSGVSGDMTLAALVSAGWPVEDLRALPVRLKLEGVQIDVQPARRGPFAALRVEVRAPGGQPHRHLRHVEAILTAADLPETVRSRALEVFRRLAGAEAEVHGTSVEKVHFHEVGAVDAIVDIVGAISGLEALGVARVWASRLPLGGGSVMSEHGRIPVPAPATAHLLRGVPVVHGPVEAELVTPTGAALLATLVADWGPPPGYRLERIGTGAGAREFPDLPNVLRLLIGSTAAGGPAREVAVLESAIDDESPQVLGHLSAALLEHGALDAMLVPALMKKGRPGSWLVVVCEVTDAQRLAEIVLRETPTLGVRIRTDSRIELPRRIEQVVLPEGTVRLKVATLPDGSERALPEFDDLREAARNSGRPLRELGQAAMERWRIRPDAAPGGPSGQDRR